MRRGRLLLVPEFPLPVVGPPEPLYRVGRKPDPWQPLDWAFAGKDLTFGNRFDDSDGYFRVLYASSSSLGCYLEVLSRYRHAASNQLTTGLAEIEHASDDFVRAGVVPASWLKPRVLGTAVSAKKLFAPVYHSAWIAFFREQIEGGHLGSSASAPPTDFDLSVLMSQRRPLTQRIATLVYRMGYDGIFYESRHGAEISNWALFEPFDLTWTTTKSLKANDPELLQALAQLNLVFDRTL